MEARRAEVLPRARGPESGESLPLEDLVAECLDAPAVIGILGPSGSGKTTALRHLAARFPDLELLDEPGPADFVGAGTIVYASHERRRRIRHRACFELAPWTDDEILEYVMAVQRDRCASVMRRVGAAPDRALAGGLPELWRAVLDTMARHDDVKSVASAFRVLFANARHAGRIALAETTSRLSRRASAWLARAPWDTRRRRLIEHDAVRVSVAAGELAARLRAGRRLHALECHPLPELLDATAPLVSASPAIVASLRREIDTPVRQSMAASLLHAAGIGWRPSRDARLEFGRFGGAAWRGVDLTGARLRYANLYCADLEGAVLDHANAEHAWLRRTRLHGASMLRLKAPEADFTEADLTAVRAPWARFDGANLRGADLRGALLDNAFLFGASLEDADLRRANLARARLRNARLDGADLSRSCLDLAHLRGLDLRRATLTGASLSGADLREANLAHVRVPGALLTSAKLQGAELTGAQLPAASLAYASLFNARLADICLEGADLRHADLQRANFHLGSSRSGLVDSPIASEGTRTGFYTDEYEEMHFKAPEDIRKANLRGADLRGARVEYTDFYLVDLREAKYDQKQENHFRRCGAILRTRAR